MANLSFTIPQFLLGMAVYALTLTLVIRLIARGYRTTKVRHILADRKVGTLMGAISIACAWAWAPAFFVSSQMTYLNGWVGLFWFTFMNAGSFVVFAFFADRFRKMVPEGYTLSGEMRDRYSPRVQRLYLLAHAILAISAFAVQLLAGGPIIESLTGLPFFWATVIFAVVPVGYTIYAGLYASVITDTVKGLIVLVIVATIIPWAIIEAGGVNTVLSGLHGIKATHAASSVFDEFFSGNGLSVMLNFGIPASLGWIAGQFGDPYYWQQAEALKKDSVKTTFLLAAPIFALIPLSLSVLGFLAGGMGLKSSNAQLVNIELIGTLLPWGAGMLFIFLLISALISTLDSHLAAIGALAGHDFFNMKRNRISRELTEGEVNTGAVRYSTISMVALVIAGIAIANGTLYLLKLKPGDTIVWLFLCYGTLRAATFLPTVITLLKRDVSEAGMFWGIVVSLFGGLPLFVYGNLYNITWAKISGSIITMLASGAMVLAVSALAKRRSHLVLT